MRVAGTRTAPGVDRADHPGRRPRQGGAHGEGAGAGRRHEAAVRLVDPDAGVRHALREPRFEARHVLVHDRLQPRIQDGGGAALELPELGLDLRRERYPEVRAGGAQGGPEPGLVLRVLEREEEAHRAGVRLLDLAEAGHRLGDRRIPEGPDHAPPRGDPLLHLEAPFARHEGRGLVPVEVVHVGPDLAADLQEVPEAGRREQHHPAAAALDDGVGGHRGPVREPAHVREGNPRLRQLAQPLQDRPPGVVAGRGPLRDPDLAVSGTHRVEVGERPSDVHPDDPAHPLLSLRPNPDP